MTLLKQLELILDTNISTSAWTDLGYYYYELLAKLHLLLVKYKNKKVCYDSVSLKKSEYFKDNLDVDTVLLDKLGRAGAIQLNALRNLREVSTKLNLRIHEEHHNYFYVNRNNVMPDNILDAFCRCRDYGRHMWIFNDLGVRNTIKEVVEGNAQIGDLLEYPKCCVNWFAETRTNSLIDCYSLCQNLPSLPLSEHATVNFLLDRFETNFVPNNEEKMMLIQKNHVEKTISKYPFVFHHACTRCLKNSTSPTSKLNQKYAKFARLISNEFHKKIIDESKKIITAYQCA